MGNTNLIYNGDFSHGTDSWYGSSITASNGIVTLTGNITQNTKYLVPVATGKRYRLTYDLKVNTNDGSHSFYIALMTYDNTKNHIGVHLTNKAIPSAQTTLASALSNGDTTVSLTSGSNWPTSRTYQRIGICNKLAWGYNRSTYSQPYQSISGNTITLKSAWAGGSWPAGTKVAEFEDGGTYFYPHSLSNSNLPIDWTTYSVEFSGGNSMRYSCQYFLFTTLGYSHNYSMRNIKIECISDLQFSHWEGNQPQLMKEGILKAGSFNDIGMPIRYVRDSINGNSANAYNHWNEIQIINYIGENIAWGKDVSGNSNTVITDGIVDSNWSSAPGTTATIDLGYVENIHKIKIWHYYPDGRTYYDNKTEVSIDGTNWYTVYSGQKPETAAGNEIILTPQMMQFGQNGEVWANELIEI